MPYSLPSLAQAQTALASRLNDPNHVHWVADELTVYLREAIRTWQAWTFHFRDQGSFATTFDTFYDLPTVLPSLRGYTVTNWELVTDIQYALMEPPAAGGTWTGTDQFTLDQLTTAIQRRRDQFLKETGIVLTRSVTTYVAPPASGRIALDETVTQVRRAAWRPVATMTLQALQRTTEWSGSNYGPTWTTSLQQPMWYSVSVVPPLTLQLMPPQTGDGDLDMVSLNIGAPLNSLLAAPLGIPDDFAWVVKFGALSDLLGGDALALDPQRAAYCEQRWQQGLDAARRAPVVLSARIDNVPVRIGAVSDADSYSPTWFLLPGTPKSLLLTGGNLLATWPPPGGGGPWTITLDVVANAPVPVIASDILQIGQDVYDSILDLAQHLALFKEGPGQLQQAMAFLDRASRAAGITTEFQQASQPDRAPAFGQQQQDRRSLPERLEDVVAIPVED